ncbi:purine-cytosine permease family protein [Nocardia wallacei]|uniref:purine-cytosine permease family protein n=1 Tax=Nocardia wallacei TaxID=480035 RepID=UPI002456E5F7|nr:cytosine permease [Nocardia wallacei]
MSVIEGDSSLHPAAPPGTAPRTLVEQRGIDHIPDSERRGTVRQLGLMWSGVILNVQVVVYGTLLVALGLNLWQAVAAIVIGAATWVIAGLASLPGPAAGTTTFAVSRAPFGRNGMRPIAFCNWLQQIGYEVMDLVLLVLAGSALLDMAGVQVGTGTKVILLVVFSVAQSVLPSLGHAAITRALHLLVAPFAALFLVMAWLTADKLQLSGGQPAGWAAFLGGTALACSASGLGWSPNATDFSRYLPRSTSRSRIVAAVTLGGAVPQALLMLLGVGVALLTSDASDPISGLPSVYPGWFLAPYLVLVIAQMISLNAIDLYSSGVTLQAIGIRIGRWQAVVLDGVICAIIGAVVVFSADFNTVVSNFLLFMIAWFAPWVAIFVVDYLLRRGRYDRDSLGTTGGRYRRPRGVHLPGVAAQAAGTLAALCWIDTSVFTGPLAHLCGGADLSVPAGLLVGGTVYYLAARTTVPAESPDTEKTPL